MIKRALWFLKHWAYSLIFGRETPEQRRAGEMLAHTPVRYEWFMQAVGRDGQPVGERIPLNHYTTEEKS